MFKSRSGSQGNASTPPPQSIEAVRPIRDDIKRRIEALLAELLP